MFKKLAGIKAERLPKVAQLVHFTQSGNHKLRMVMVAIFEIADCRQ